MHCKLNGESAGYNLPRQGGVAYAAQEGWVQIETIRVSTAKTLMRWCTSELASGEYLIWKGV